MYRSAPIRRHTRFPVRWAVTYENRDFSTLGTLLDFSRAGAHLVGPVPVNVGMPLSLHILLPEEAVDLRIAQATVRWVKGSEFGVEARELSEEVRAWLDHFHDQVLGDRPCRQRYADADMPRGLSLARTVLR